MKKHTKKVVITEVTYETVDGKFFSNPSEALRHEERLEANKQFLNLPTKYPKTPFPGRIVNYSAIELPEHLMCGAFAP